MGFIGKAVKAVVKGIFGIVGKVVGGIFGFLVGKSKSQKSDAPNNLTKNLNPEEPRKIVFGRVAAPLDTRYWEVWGTDGSKFDEVIAVATHRINSFLELYVEDELAINAAGAVQGKYVGVLTRDTRTGQAGQTGIVAGAGNQYNATSTFDGCSSFKLAWVPDEKKLPNGIPSRYTQVIEGAPVYDPRRDSTVAGGSGTHRINDRSTWAYATLDGNGVPIGRNNALQALWYLLGWTIPMKNAAGALTGEEMLVAGRGVDPNDINLATFIAAANACEVAGYYTDMVLSTEADHTENEDVITCDGLIGRLIDPGGLWSYYANVDDTANIAVTLTDADVLDTENIEWNEYLGLSEQYNQVGGKFVNPSATSLYQPYPYPLVRDSTYETNLGIKRRKTRDFRQVLDNTLAQRLARLLLNEGQYQGEFNAAFNYKALRAQAWSVVQYQSDRFGWTKLFRVWRHEISGQKGIKLTLKEIHPSIWSAGTVNAAIAPSDAINIDAVAPISPTGVVASLITLTGADGTKADGFKLSWNLPSLAVRRTEIRFRQVGAVNWINGGTVNRSTIEVTYAPLFSGTQYEAQIRHISVLEVEGAWTAASNSPFTLGTQGNLTYAQIQAAGSTANWSQIYNDNGMRPEDGADVTATHVASGITSQGAFATLNSISLADQVRLTGFLRTSQVAWTSNNLIANGDFATGDFTNWTQWTGAAYQTVGAYANAPAQYSVSFGPHPDNVTSLTTGVFAAENAYSEAGSSTDGFAVEPGREYLVSLDYMSAGFSGGFAVIAYFFKNDGTWTSNLTAIPAPAVYSGTWATIAGTFVAPAGALRCWLYVRAATWTSGRIYWTNLRAVERRAFDHLTSTAVRFGINTRRNDGLTLVNDIDAITSLGIASGFNNQTAWATLTLPTTRLNNLSDTGSFSSLDFVTSRNLSQLNSRAWTNLFRANGTTPIVDVDAITSLGIASGINNQGSLATLNSVAYGSANVTGFGSLAARNNARLGFEIYRNNGSTLINDADAITSLGVASAITSQGYFATANSIVLSDRVRLTGAITTLQQAIAANNLIANHDFATNDFTNWNIPTGSTVVDISAVANAPAPKAIQVTYPGSGTSFVLWAASVSVATTPDAFNDGFTVEPGREYLFALNTIVGGGWVGDLQVRIYWLLANGTNTSTLLYNSTTPPTAWASSLISASAVAPANAIRGFVRVAATAWSAGWVQATNFHAHEKRAFDQLTATAVRLGINITRNDGATSLTDALAVTSLGVASGITNQSLWATYATITPTTMSNRTQYLDNTTGRITDTRGLRSNRSYGMRSVFSGLTFTDTWVGANNVTINIPASSFDNDLGSNISLPSGSITNCTAATKYYIYRNMTDPTSSTGSYAASTTLQGALGPDKVYLGYWTTRASSGADGGGGSIGGNDCVVCQAFVPTLDGVKIAENINPLDCGLCLNESDMNSSEYVPVVNNFLGMAECVKLTTESGIELTVSIDAPLTLPNNDTIPAPAGKDNLIWVKDKEGERWEQIDKVEPVGYMPVSHISFGGRVFAAGNKPDAFMFTHNPTKP